jgi:hypothetical protein
MSQAEEQVTLPNSVRQVADLLRAFAKWGPNGRGYDDFVDEARAYLTAMLTRPPSASELEAFIQDVRQ